MNRLRAVLEKKELLLEIETRTKIYFSKIIFFLYALISFGLFGCGPHFAFDHWFSVIGEIKNELGKQVNSCAITLLDHEEKTIEAADSIPGKFHKIFHVRPEASEYIILIYCPDYKPIRRSVTYTQTVTPVRPLNMGVVIVEPTLE